MKRQEAKLIPFRDWPKPAQDRLIDDAIDYFEKHPAPNRELRMQGPELEFSAHRGREFLLCVAVVAAFLIGLLAGMWFQSIVKHFSS